MDEAEIKAAVSAAREAVDKYDALCAEISELNEMMDEYGNFPFERERELESRLMQLEDKRDEFGGMPYLRTLLAALDARERDLAAAREALAKARTILESIDMDTPGSPWEWDFPSRLCDDIDAVRAYLKK